MAKATYQGIYPIGDTDPANMPVADVDRAARWYVDKMGFAVESREARRVVVKRDDVEIGLAANGGDPEQASCYVEVSDPEAARSELAAAGVWVNDLRINKYQGDQYRVFYAKDEDGLCYCIGIRLVDGEV